MRRLRRREAVRAPLLRIDPPIAEGADLQRVGFRFAPRQVQPRATIIVDLEPGPEEILARFNSQVRYNARLAERKGVEISEGGAGAVEEFWKLLTATANVNPGVVNTLTLAVADANDHVYDSAVLIQAGSLSTTPPAPPGTPAPSPLILAMLSLAGMVAYFVISQRRSRA